MATQFIWIPRVLAITLALFMTVFALDVLEEHATMLARAEALFIHLLPSILILLSLLLSWNKPRRGALVFTFLAALYIINEWGHWNAIGLIALPLFITGILFWIAAMKGTSGT